MSALQQLADRYFARLVNSLFKTSPRAMAEKISREGAKK